MGATLPGTAIALLLLPVLFAAEEPANEDFNCSFVLGSANLLVDGSLSEWDSRTVPQSLKWSKSFTGEPPDTSTATARCLADDRALYLGIAVAASPLRFETMPFNQAWRNDSVEVFISVENRKQSSYLRTGLIRVSPDSSGRTIVEGSASVTDGVHITRQFSYPWLWEAVGVKAGLRATPGGYAVEVAIPRYSIGWTGALPAPRVSMNVRVRRSCGNRPCRAVIELSEDPYNSSPVSDERYRTVSFRRQLPATGGALALAPGDEAVAALVYGAILRLDAFDPGGAAALLRESQDRRLLPVVGSALMAAGRPDAALSVLSGISPEGDAVRMWVTEQMAYSSLLQGDVSVAEGQYAALAAYYGHPAFQDIGVAGLIDLALAAGRGEAGLAIYEAAFGGRGAPGMRSGSRIAGWLHKQGRDVEAIEVLARLSECEWAHDSERAGALFELQSLYRRHGDIEKAVATGWRLQALAPPGDSAGEAGLKGLMAMAAFGRTADSADPPFSDAYRRFLEGHPGATDPARRMAFAMQLQWEGKPAAAVALYEEVSRETSARREERAAALLGLQRLRFDSGQVERSVETGLAIGQAFPGDFLPRLASWQLIRAACGAGGTPGSLRRQVEEFGAALAKDLRSAAQDDAGVAQGRARALLLQFEKELNLQ